MACSDTKLPLWQWRETHKGVWERDIDECEKFYRLSKRKDGSCFPITGCASFVTKPTDNTTIDEEKRRVEAALRKAWVMLRHKHPALDSRIEHEEGESRLKRVYISLQDAGAERCWLNSTFKVVNTDRGALQWFNNDAPTFEAPTIYLVKSQQENERNQTIFLRCPHDITDGIGILQLVDQLFRHAALAYERGAKHTSPEWGTEFVRLSPCLRVAAPIHDTLSEAQSKRWEEIQVQNAAVYQHSGLLSLPSTAAVANSARVQIQRVSSSMSRTTSSQLLHSCKAIAPGVSLTHVFMSALALVLAELQPRKEESFPVRYVNHSMINLRPYCQHPYDTADHAAVPYHTISAQALAIDLVVPGSCIAAKEESETHDLSWLATKVRDFYKVIRPVSSEETHEQLYLAPWTFSAFTPRPDLDPHAVSEPPFCPVALSSIGSVASIVSKSHGPFELTNVWACSEPIGAGVALFLGSWDGEIQLSGVFDARYHTSEFLDKFLGRIVSCACVGLGINELSASE